MNGLHLQKYEVFKDEFVSLAPYNKNYIIRSYLNFISELEQRNKKFFIYKERVKKIPRDIITISGMFNEYTVEKNKYTNIEYMANLFNNLSKATNKLESVFKKFNLTYENYELDDIKKKQQPFYRNYLEKNKR